MSGPHPLLLVEDDPQLSGLLDELLTDAGYVVDVARDGQRGLHLGLTRQYDVMIVDRGLPAIEGADLIKRLRTKGVATPTLILTALGSVADRVEGLDAGAEDYLIKPFEVEELLARLRALVRRHAQSATTVNLGCRSLDLPSRQVVGGGEDPTELSGRECDLLRILATRPSRVFTREELLVSVFSEADTLGSVDTYVHYLRRKLGSRVIETVRGTGYRMGTT